MPLCVCVCVCVCVWLALMALNTKFGQLKTLLEVTPPATTHSDNSFRYEEDQKHSLYIGLGPD